MRWQPVTAWTACALIALGGTVVACDDGTTYCGDGTQVCDDLGQPLIYAPYLIPAYGIYGHPGYVAPVTIYPGAPNYHTTYVGHPPNYNPPVTPKPPPTNPKNTVATSVKAPAPSGYKAPTVPAKPSGSSGGSGSGSGVKAPSVKVQAPAVKPPSVKVGR